MVIDYHEQETITKYYTGADFVSKVGGYSASFNALWVYVAPFFLLYFLYNLALVIKNGARIGYQKELLASIIRLSKILNQYRQGSIQINENAELVTFKKPIWTDDEDVQKLRKIDLEMETMAYDYEYYQNLDSNKDLKKVWPNERKKLNDLEAVFKNIVDLIVKKMNPNAEEHEIIVDEPIKEEVSYELP